MLIPPTVCCVIVLNDKKEILFIKRGREPFKGRWALISGIGYFKKDLSVEEGVLDEVLGDTGTTPIDVQGLFLMESDNQRVQVFKATLNVDDIKIQPPYSTDFIWKPIDRVHELGNLAFDHKEILKCLELN